MDGTLATPQEQLTEEDLREQTAKEVELDRELRREILEEQMRGYAARAAAREREARLGMQSRTIAVTTFLSILTALATLFRTEIANVSGSNPLILVAALGSTSLALGSTLLYLYLRGWEPRVISTKLEDQADPKLQEFLESFFKNIVPNKSESIESLKDAPSSSAEIAQILRSNVQSDHAPALEEKFDKQSAQAHTAKENARRFNAAVKRLEREIAEQSKKGSLNLSIGVGTTVAAVSLLVWMVAVAPTGMDSLPKIVSHYLPWLSLVAFIEVFSFFFLRLYKTTLEEARRYNDDLTRLTLQWVATDTGRHAEEEGAVSALAKGLLSLSKQPQLASAEASKLNLDSDKMLKALLSTLSRQFGENKKRPKSEEDE